MSDRVYNHVGHRLWRGSNHRRLLRFSAISSPPFASHRRRFAPPPLSPPAPFSSHHPLFLSHPIPYPSLPTLSRVSTSHATLEPIIKYETGEFDHEDDEFEAEIEDFESEEEEEDRVLNYSPSTVIKESNTKLPLRNLTVKEKKELASYAHSHGKKLKSEQVGKSGVTDSVATALIETLEANELLKEDDQDCPGVVDQEAADFRAPLDIYQYFSPGPVSNGHTFLSLST